MSKWTEATAKGTINRTGGRVESKHIQHSKAGLKVLSAIDYLTRVHKYVWVRG